MSRWCPDDITLEAHLYRDLAPLKEMSVRVHLTFCKRCRDRVEALRRFSECISHAAYVEPPEGFVSNLVKSVDSWGVPTPVSPDEGSDEERPIRGPSLRVRWALGAVTFLASLFIQWRYGDTLPGYLSESYLFDYKDLKNLVDFVWSGTMWRNIVAFVTALRTDGLSALQILGTALPMQIAGVVVFGGIITAVFVSQLKASRMKREGRR